MPGALPVLLLCGAAAACHGILIEPSSRQGGAGPHGGHGNGSSDSRSSHTRAQLNGLSNPAGCVPNGRDGYSMVKPMEELAGVYPIEDFRRMLDEPFTNRAFGAPCAEQNRNVKWCPRPEPDTSFAPGSLIMAPAEEHLTEQLKGIDTSKPLIVAAYDIEQRGSAEDVQVANFICGLERLGLANRAVIFAGTRSAADDLRVVQSSARVIYSEAVLNVSRAIGVKTQMSRTSRALKLAIAKVLVNIGRELILSDIDIYWVRDPTPAFQAHEGLEFAAMKDACWLELNSGFLYYRSTPAVKQMLDIALTTYREKAMCADNDQYLLNCGFAHAAVEGLNYAILPPKSFTVGSSPSIGGNRECRGPGVPGVSQSVLPRDRYLGDGSPYVWHTYGLSTGYAVELDMLAAFGCVDVDADTGKCLPGSRGGDDDVQLLRERSAASCREDGLLHAGCYGKCSTAPERSNRMTQAWKALRDRVQVPLAARPH